MLSLLPSSVAQHARLRSIVITSSDCAALRRGHSCGTNFHEVLARNVGILAAVSAGCEVIVSSNIDVVPPERQLIDELIGAMPTWQHAFTVPRVDKKLGEPLPPPPVIAVQPWNRTVHVRYTMRLGEDLTNQRKEAPSIITNCGDFQMARRELWRRVAFAWRLDGKRQYADSFMQARLHMYGLPTV